MDRKKFLLTLGIGATAIAFIDLIPGCKKTDVPVNFTIDTTNSPYTALETPGGYIYLNGVIVARTSANTIIAVSQACTHAGCNVVFENQQNDFYCPCHGSVFSATGTVVNGPATTALILYNVQVTGTSIHVYS